MQTLNYDNVFRDETSNVVGLIEGRAAEPAVLLCTHLDTVPTGDRAAWSEDPYGGRIDGGRLHGRGAADCKGGLAAQVYSGALLKRLLLPLQGTLIVAATVAEENGLGVGVRPLLETTLPDIGLRRTFAILGEPTELGLYYGHDGWLETDIEVKGDDPIQVEQAAGTIFADLERTRRTRWERANGREDLAVYSPRFSAAESGAPCATI